MLPSEGRGHPTLGVKSICLRGSSQLVLHVGVPRNAKKQTEKMQTTVGSCRLISCKTLGVKNCFVGFLKACEADKIIFL